MIVYMLIAYIDPGAGAMMLQWCLAAIIGSVLYFRAKLVSGLRRLFGQKRKPGTGRSGETPTTPEDPGKETGS